MSRTWDKLKDGFKFGAIIGAVVGAIKGLMSGGGFSGALKGALGKGLKWGAVGAAAGGAYGAVTKDPQPAVTGPYTNVQDIYQNPDMGTQFRDQQAARQQVQAQAR